METKDNKPAEDARYKKELKRIIKLLKNAGVKDEKINLMNPVIENTAWMKVKLDDARVAVKNSQIVIAYDNGGNQRGLRENPMFKGYESLWKSYMTGMCKIIDCIPDSMSELKKEESEKPINMLDVIRARKQA